MGFRPQPSPVEFEDEKLQRFARHMADELQRLSGELEVGVDAILMPELNVDVLRPRNGMISFFDGVNFDPGFGPGFYGRVAEAWAPLGSPVFNVKLFGAKGDGVTDDRAAIQATIDAAEAAGGGIVLFPPGVYLISSGLTLKEGAYLEGSGPRKTEIKGNGDFAIFTGLGTVSDAFRDCEVRDMLIRGSGQANTSAHGIVLEFPNRVRLFNLVFHATRKAISIKKSTATKLLNIDIDGAGSDQNWQGVVLEESTESNPQNAIDVLNVKTQFTVSSGFRLIHPQSSKFVNCDCAGTDQDPGWDIGGPEISTSTIQFLTIVNCLSDTTTGDCWRFRKTGTVTANALRDMQLGIVWAGTGVNGMSIEGGNNFTIVNFMCRTMSQNGLLLTDCNRCGIGFSLIRGWDTGAAGFHGMNLVNTDLCQIVGNQVQDGGSATGKSISLDASSGDNIVGLNELGNGATNLGANNIISRNTSFKTENKGTGTITSGSTSVTVNHGLAVTPSLEDIVLTQLENPTNDPGGLWPSNPTSTQFTINCRNDPGASNLDVGWQVTSF